ncbi:MAG: 16S rRNA (uracil(1498)-N(3))-methyltransferase [Clostridia bacterium]
MPKFFAPAIQISNTGAFIIGDDAKHIARVLRMNVGDTITLCNGEGMDFDCEISSLSTERVDLSVLGVHACVTEPSVKITLFMALAKGDKMDYVIQKSVELGVFSIVPFLAKRCVAKISAADSFKKTARWQKISESAAKQCGRGIIPHVSEPVSFEQMLTLAKACDRPLFFYEGECDASLKSAIGTKPFKTASVVIGPEGGFDPIEVEKAHSGGLISVSLGPRILRCETAPGCAICAIMFETGNL